MVLGPYHSSSCTGTVSLSKQFGAAIFKIRDQRMAENLRTDLKGTSIKVALPENALDRPWDDGLIASSSNLPGSRSKPFGRQRYDRRFGGLPTGTSQADPQALTFTPLILSGRDPF